MNDEQNTLELFKHGSTWVRADFHLHTQSDREFIYDDSKHDFVSTYIEKLKLSSISVGVIANHNKFKLDEYKNLSKAAAKEEIFLLPGVELSVNDGSNGVHAIIVFNPEEWIHPNTDFINQFLDNTFKGKIKQDYENNNGRSNHNLVQTIVLLNEFHKEYFIIMAHVDQDNGFCNEFDGGRIIEFGLDPLFRSAVLGLQKLKSHDNENNLNQWLQNRIPALVEGSDPKNIDEIGKGNPCFIKIGDFNFDCLKFAFIAFSDRITRNINFTKNNSVYIKSIAFQGKKISGEVCFSSKLNNLIGIRGSGKSSIIELLRDALDVPFGQKAVDIHYKKLLNETNLGSGGKITIILSDKSDHVYKIEKIYDHKSNIFMDGQPQNITVDAIVPTPIIYFGQKDLSSSNEGFEEDLIDKLIGTKLKEIKDHIEIKKNEIIRILSEINIYNEIDSKKEEILIDKQNKEHQIQSYKKYNIDEKLKKQLHYDNDELKLRSISDFVNSYSEALKKLIEDHQYRFDHIKNYESAENAPLFDKLYGYIDLLKKGFEKIKKIHEESDMNRKSIQILNQEFQNLKENQKEEFAQIKREINLPSLNADDFVKLTKSLSLIDVKLDEIEKSFTKKTSLQKQLYEALIQINDLWLQEFHIIKQEVDRINRDQKSLKIDVAYKANKDEFKKYLTNILKGSGLYETDIEKITADYADCIEIFKDRTKLTIRDNKLLKFNEYFDNNLTALLTYKVPNKTIIKYHDKELKEHSLGQRASALILFILAQKQSNIIIIDQPEDDLDNQTIYEDMIQKILELKNNVQFIFATHNANIPVVGDSEQIVACNYENGKIVTETGSIDRKHIQKKIVDIMEGGTDAFNRRKEIYKQLWKL